MRSPQCHIHLQIFNCVGWLNPIRQLSNGKHAGAVAKWYIELRCSCGKFKFEFGSHSQSHSNFFPHGSLSFLYYVINKRGILETKKHEL